jgi:cytochrome c-type biogenesis protein CcmH/NrfF
VKGEDFDVGEDIRSSLGEFAWRRTRASGQGRRPPARAAAAMLLALTVAALAVAGPAAAAPTRRVSLNAIMPDFMCVLCHEPLDVSQSPEALQERSFLAGLVAKGETKTQIENAMVAQYSPAVLGVPKAKGFNAVLYILPPVVLLAGLASLAVLIPRWRRRGRSAAALAVAPEPALDAADAQRLDEELARYQG